MKRCTTTFGGLRSEHRRVVVGSDRDDDVDPLAAYPVEENLEHSGVAVPYCPEAHVHDRMTGEVVEPRHLTARYDRPWLADRLDCLQIAKRWDLQTGRTDVEVEVFIQATGGMGIEAVHPPQRGRGVPCERGDFWGNQRAEAVRRVRDPVCSRGDRPGELGHLVHNQVGFERFDNGAEVFDALRCLRLHEPFGERMATDLGRRKGGKYPR